MRGLVRGSWTSPLVTSVARNIVRGARSPDEAANAIHDWLYGHFLFRRDPDGLELLADPDYLLRQGNTTGYVEGDCDDAAVLAAALGGAVGLPARFRVVGFGKPNAPYSHVYTLLRGTGRWWKLDVTRSYQAPVPSVSRSLEVEV